MAKKVKKPKYQLADYMEPVHFPCEIIVFNKFGMGSYSIDHNNIDELVEENRPDGGDHEVNDLEFMSIIGDLVWDLLENIDDTNSPIETQIKYNRLGIANAKEYIRKLTVLVEKMEKRQFELLKKK